MADVSFKIKVSVEPDSEPEPWNGEGIAGKVVKADSERRYTLSVAYPVNKPDVGTARDGYRDFAGTDAVQECAWNYMLKCRSVGRWHEDNTEGAGTPVESYLWPSDEDWVIKADDGSEQRVTKGDWLLGVIWDEDTWDLIKKGELAGMSPQGMAQRVDADPDKVAGLRK